MSDASGRSRRAIVLAKSRHYLQKLDELQQTPSGEAARLVRQEIVIDWSLLKLARIADVKRAGVVVTATMVQKAMFAARIVTTDEARECAEAIGSLAADFGAAAALGPETLGLGALLPLGAAALDAYDMSSHCFHLDGRVSHALAVREPDGTETSAGADNLAAQR